MYVIKLYFLCSPVEVEVRLYSSLFLHANPEEQPGGFMSDINPDSKRVMTNAMADRHLKGAKELDRLDIDIQ